MSLSRRYGYFRCSSCSKEWESSHVYCRKDTDSAVYGQECKHCRVICMPYRVEKLVCSTCASEMCVCIDKRHTDQRKSHRSDLCAKCRAGLPCQR